jgi:hypothetical protein
VSYLVVISASGETVFSGVFGDKEGNNAGMRRKLEIDKNCTVERCVMADFDVVHR